MRSSAITAALVACMSLLALVEPAASDGRDAEAEEARITEVTRPTGDFSRAEPFEMRPAGAATVFKALDRDSFSHPSANMDFTRQRDFKIGNAIFRKEWVSSPSSTPSSDGLGPLFNSRACQHCHRKDGRGHLPVEGEVPEALFLRLSIPPQTEAQREDLRTNRIRVVPEPSYGTQLQTFSIQGHLAEARLGIEYDPLPVTLADGTRIELRKPRYEISDLNYGPLHPETMVSPRMAPPMIGMGLLEAIREADILALADPDDADGDGISGRPNRVWNAETNRVDLGRFGWKAGKASIADQTASAFAGDIGISTPMYRPASGDCTELQVDCLNAPHGGPAAEDTVEISQELFDLVVFYSRNLGVPARRDVENPKVLRGKELFYGSGCIACHRPKFVTGRDADPEHAFQLIWPYTDLLLHDMGDGLADGRPEGEADGREWRTPPLWGIGLTETVGGEEHYLHDGRARNLLEAILWHGGEAEAARQNVMHLSAEERDALIAFLKSL